MCPDTTSQQFEILEINIDTCKKKVLQGKFCTPKCVSLPCLPIGAGAGGRALLARLLSVCCEQSPGACLAAGCEVTGTCKSFREYFAPRLLARLLSPLCWRGGVGTQCHPPLQCPSRQKWPGYVDHIRAVVHLETHHSYSLIIYIYSSSGYSLDGAGG